MCARPAAPRAEPASRPRANPVAATSRNVYAARLPRPTHSGRYCEVNGTSAPTQPTWAKESARIIVRCSPEDGEAERGGDPVGVLRDDPRARPGRAAAADERTKRGGESQQHQCGQARAAGDQPDRHRATAATGIRLCGQAPVVTTVPSSPTSRAVRLRVSSQATASSPMTIAAVLAVFAASAHGA